jgi:hypothetical protein
LNEPQQCSKPQVLWVAYLVVVEEQGDKVHAVALVLHVEQALLVEVVVVHGVHGSLLVILLQDASTQYY